MATDGPAPGLTYVLALVPWSVRRIAAAEAACLTDVAAASAVLAVGDRAGERGPLERRHEETDALVAAGAWLVTRG